MIPVPLSGSPHSFSPTAEFFQITSYTGGVGVDNEALQGGEVEADIREGWSWSLGGFGLLGGRADRAAAKETEKVWIPPSSVSLQLTSLQRVLYSCALC